MQKKSVSVNGDSVRQVAGGIAPWVIAAFALIGFFWQQVNPREDIRQVEQRLDEKITQAEHRSSDANNSLDKRINEIIANISKLLLTIAEFTEFKIRKDNDTTRMDSSIRMLAETRIHRTEYERELTNVAERITALRVVVEKLQADVFGSYNVGKQLDSLGLQQVEQAKATAAQIQELRRVIDMMRLIPTSPISAPGAAITVPGPKVPN